MSTDLIDKLALQLRDAGIGYAFGITGSGLSLRLIEALDGLGVSYFPVRHEAAAAVMAGACCRDGISRAASITIKGPGFANLVPGILSNRYEGRPAISISEAYAAHIPGWRKHKRLDHFALSSGITKGAAQADVESEALKSLFFWAQAEYPGPVHIDLCPAQGESVELTHEPSNNRAVDSQWEPFLERINRSSRPALILGSLATRALKSVEWHRLSIPILTTAAAKGAVDETTPFSAGIVTGEVSELSPETTLLSKADLIVGIGLRNEEVVKAAPYGVESLIADSVGGDCHDGFEASRVLVSADMEPGIGSLFQLLSGKNWGADEILAANRRVARHLGGGWLPARLFRQLQERLPAETTLVPDTGFFCTVGETVWSARSPDHFCGSSVARFMGTALPTAVGIALSRPAQPVLCVMGDGGLAPYLSEMALAVQERLPILFINISDGRYGSIAAYAGDSPAVRRAVNVGCKTAWKVAEALECPAFQVNNGDELDAALAGWQPACGPRFLQCPFEPVAYAAQARELR